MDNRGLIKFILLIIIAIIVLGYFGLDVQEIINRPQVQENLRYVWDAVKRFFTSIQNFFL